MNHTDTGHLVQVGLTADSNLVDQFDEIARKHDRSRAGEIRFLMQRHVTANTRRPGQAEPTEAEAA